MNLHDVAVLQSTDGLGFDLESIEFVLRRLRDGSEHLDRDRPSDRRLPGAIDDAHAAAADFLNDFVTGDGRQRTADSARR